MADDGGAESKLSPQQRKEARRARIQRRIREEREAANPSLRQPEERELTVPEQRIADGLSTLDATKSATIEDTTGVRLEVDVRENRRKTESEAARHQRLRRLQEEALESGRRNAAIEMRWAETLQVDTPQALRDAVQKQVEACAAIRRSKDEMVSAFRTQLKAADEEFVEAVQLHGADVDELLRRMEKQFHELAASYDEELAAIEDAFDAERAGLLEANREEVNALFERRRKQELELVEKSRKMQNEFMDTMDAMRAEDAEEYNQLKVCAHAGEGVGGGRGLARGGGDGGALPAQIKLQNEIQALEQQLQDMRATYLLNQEKLEYNFRVLTERDVENSNTISQQKKKLQRLKDSLAKLTSRYEGADAHFKQVNGRLAAEYKKLTDQVGGPHGPLLAWRPHPPPPPFPPCPVPRPHEEGPALSGGGQSPGGGSVGHARRGNSGNPGTSPHRRPPAPLACARLGVGASSAAVRQASAGCAPALPHCAGGVAPHTAGRATLTASFPRASHARSGTGQTWRGRWNAQTARPVHGRYARTLAKHSVPKLAQTADRGLAALLPAPHGSRPAPRHSLCRTRRRRRRATRQVPHPPRAGATRRGQWQRWRLPSRLCSHSRSSG